ncbi:hypothetical protein KY084_05295 [Stakelama sp. CBK3Z-3]|uniref:Toxin-antitoxin system YwqK family antitoxin n=1 Tax=Stakelama flava TaxID=2860338 RepID=A0ABS6XJZ3_9SPHN|nr:hypothetical protein [Stakelama flava]MBW4330244.1 hypothetical protein [Stakelama flava]MBW4330286.1 hypothetical protein [Stakelama flava]
MTLPIATLGALLATSAASQSVEIKNHEQVAESDLCHVPGRPGYTGMVELRRDDRTLMRQVACVDGEKDGRDRQFHRNGTLAMERHWKAGALSGRYRSWYPDGTLKEAWTYGPHGLEGVYRVYHPNGRPAAIAHWRDGKRDGDYADYDKAGHMIERGRYRAGYADGPVIEYLPSGKAFSIKRYAMGKRVGIQALWSKTNGRLLRRFEYSSDGKFVDGRVWNVDGTPRRITRPVTIPGYGRGLKMIRYEGCRTYTVLQSGTDDPARLPEIGYSFTPHIYKLETVRSGDEIIERVEAYDHKLLAPVIRKDRQCCECPQ